MATIVNIAFTGGVESTYMLQMALEQGHRVNVIFINVGGDPMLSIGEIAGMQKTLAYLRDPENKERYPGTINRVLYFLSKPHLNITQGRWSLGDGACRFVTTDMTQQWATIQALMKVRQAMLLAVYPTTFIGWIKADSSDVTMNEMDFSEADYMNILQLPATIGKLNSSDRMAMPFRAPLWNMTKKEIYSKLDDKLKEFIIPNGISKIYEEDRLFIHTPMENKVKEYTANNIPIKEKYVFEFDDSDIMFMIKWFSGFVPHTDLDLPSEARYLINNFATLPMMPNRQHWYEEESLAFLKSNFKSLLYGFWEKSQKFQWPAEPVAKEEPKYDTTGDVENYTA